jgi:hypothetical protein
MHNNTQSSPNQPWEGFMKRMPMVVLTILGAMIFVVSISAQSFEAADARTGSILGTVVDTSDDPIPSAAVVLQGPSGDRLTVATRDDGTFAFQEAKPGTYQITAAAEGFADWSSSVTVEPGQAKTLIDVRLRILAVQ